MLNYFITYIEIPNVPIVYEKYDLYKKPKYFKVYYKNSTNIYNFFICIPICFRQNLIIYQEAVYE